VVKYGFVKLISTKEDLCQQMANVDKECPLEKGESIITKEVDLPKEIPPVSRTSSIAAGILIF
jgi:hypothetical protein